MQLLLDTHALIWWLHGDRRMSRTSRASIDDSDNEVFVSAASAWEITTKFRLGKLPDVKILAEDVGATLTRVGFKGLPITVHQAAKAGGLPGPLKDPFDRLLIAQALLEGIALVSNEATFDVYGVTRVW